MTAATILTAVYWVVLLAVTIGSVVFSVFASRRTLFLWLAAGLLAAGIVLVSIGTPPVPVAVAVPLALLSIALAVIGGGPAVLRTLSLAGGDNAAGSHGGIIVHDGDEEPSTSNAGAGHEVLRGGSTIGILERLAVACAIIAGHPEAIALIVALKGVGRFSELNASEARERFIIGSLVSLIWASASAALFVIATR